MLRKCQVFSLALWQDHFFAGAHEKGLGIAAGEEIKNCCSTVDEYEKILIEHGHRASDLARTPYQIGWVACVELCFLG